MNKFFTDQFGFTDSSFHLLRSKFPISKHELHEVDSISIHRGRQVANWLILLAVGIGMVASGVLFYSVYLGNASSTLEEGGTVLVGRWSIAPLFLIAIGSACVYYSFKNGWVMTVALNGKRYRFPLERLLRDKRLDQMVWFLTNHPVTQRVFDAKEWKGMGR